MTLGTKQKYYEPDATWSACGDAAVGGACDRPQGHLINWTRNSHCRSCIRQTVSGHPGSAAQFARRRTEDGWIDRRMLTGRFSRSVGFDGTHPSWRASHRPFPVDYRSLALPFVGPSGGRTVVSKARSWRYTAMTGTVVGFEPHTDGAWPLSRCRPRPDLPWSGCRDFDAGRQLQDRPSCSVIRLLMQSVGPRVRITPRGHVSASCLDGWASLR